MTRTMKCLGYQGWPPPTPLRFFDQPWFSRMWTVQELAMAQRAKIVWGDQVDGLGFPCHCFFNEPHISRPRRFPVVTIPAYTPSTAFSPLRKRPGAWSDVTNTDQLKAAIQTVHHRQPQNFFSPATGSMPPSLGIWCSLRAEFSKALITN